jgi:hypothetical protein
MAQDDPNMAKDVPKIAPRWPQYSPRWPQHGPKTAQHGPKTDQHGPTWPQDNRRLQQLLIRWSLDLLSHLHSKGGRRQRRSLHITQTGGGPILVLGVAFSSRAHLTPIPLSSHFRHGTQVKWCKISSINRSRSGSIDNIRINGAGHSFPIVLVCNCHDS